MRRENGKKRRKWTIFAGVGLLAVFLAAGGVCFLLHSKKTKAAIPAQALSVNASKGTLSTTIVGSGHLENAEAQEIQVPAGLSIETVNVESGDTVSAGDVLALVNEAALTAEIAQIQSVIAELDEQINEKTGETESQYVTSKVEGRVKKICVEAGDDVADVMVSDGALLLLSLDGKMAVQIETGSETAVGSTVSVALSSGTTVSGTVENCTGSKVTVTLTDDGTILGDTVTVSDSSGQAWGTGTLYVHQPLEITGTSGQVSAIHVAEDQWVEAGEDLFTLVDVPVSAEYQELLAVRTVYKEKLKELLAMADGCAVTAPVDGVIESVGLTEGSTTSVSSTGNASAEEETSVNGGNSSIPAEGMAFSSLHSTNAFQAYSMKLSTGSLKSVEGSPLGDTDLSVSQGSILENSQDTGDDKETEDRPEQKEEQKENAGQGQEQENKDEEQVNAQNEVKEESRQNTGQGQAPQQDTGQGQVLQQSAGAAQAASDISAQAASEDTENNTEDPSADPFSIPDIQGLQEQVTGFTIAVQDHMILSVDIDELDILSVKEGQEVQITMDAAEGKVFSGEVTKVSDSTSGSDGSAKYTVEVTVPKDDLMRVGMSASATIVTEKKENVVVVPADAVQERGRRVFVYTQYDSKSGALSGETQVQTGMSDGEKVEITSGLAEGDTVYYEKMESQPSEENSRGDQMEGSFDFDMNGGGQPGGGSGGGMPGGGMPDGSMPDGAPGGHMGGPGGQ